MLYVFTYLYFWLLYVFIILLILKTRRDCWEFCLFNLKIQIWKFWKFNVYNIGWCNLCNSAWWVLDYSSWQLQCLAVVISFLLYQYSWKVLFQKTSSHLLDIRQRIQFFYGILLMQTRTSKNINFRIVLRTVCQQSFILKDIP